MGESALSPIFPNICRYDSRKSENMVSVEEEKLEISFVLFKIMMFSSKFLQIFHVVCFV